MIPRGNPTATRTANVRGYIPFRRLAAGDILSRPGDTRARSAVREILAETVGGGTADHGIALGRRSGLVRRRALSVVQRYSQQPHPQMGRGNRRGQHLPQAVEFRQRPYPRPPGTPDHLRARRPPRYPHRIWRPDHGADGLLRRQTAELAGRRRGEIRRLELVPRSAVWPARA